MPASRERARRPRPPSRAARRLAGRGREPAARRARPRRARARRPRRGRISNAGSRHPQLLRAPPRTASSSAGGRPRCVRRSPRPRGRRRLRRQGRRPRPRAPRCRSSAPAKVREPRPTPRSRNAEDVVLVSAVLPLELLEGGDPLADVLQPFGVGEERSRCTRGRPARARRASAATPLARSARPRAPRVELGRVASAAAAAAAASAIPSSPVSECSAAAACSMSRSTCARRPSSRSSACRSRRPGPTDSISLTWYARRSSSRSRSRAARELLELRAREAQAVEGLAVHGERHEMRVARERSRRPSASAGGEEALRLVLAVDLDEVGAERRRASTPWRAAPRCAAEPLPSAATVRARTTSPSSAQLGRRGPAPDGVEPGLHARRARAVRTSEAEPGRRARAASPTVTMVLPAPGLAGEHVQAGMELELEVVDHPEAADVELPEHAAEPSGRRRHRGPPATRTSRAPV